MLINTLSLRGRCAIAAATAGRGAEAAWLATAERDARRIERERMPWGKRAGETPAGRRRRRSRRDGRGGALLEAAEKELDAADMALHATVARRRRGELAGGDDGRALIEAADAWMAGQGIRNPERMAAMLAPGAWARARALLEAVDDEELRERPGVGVGVGASVRRSPEPRVTVNPRRHPVARVLPRLALAGGGFDAQDPSGRLRACR